MAHEAVWWRVAWRNLWRNRGRTLVTASGLALGYLSAVLMVGLMDGMNAMLIENGTRLMVSQIQIHSDDYLPERNMHRTIGGYDGTDIPALLAQVDASPDVVAATPRLFGGGLISSGDQTQAALLLGIDPEREARVSMLLDNLEGHAPVPGAYEIAVGAEMARQLGLSIGEELVVVAPAADGSMGNDLFTLVGLFRTGTPTVDANYAFLPIADLQYLMAMDPGRIHEVAVTVSRPWDTDAIMTSLTASLNGDGPPLDLRTWAQLRPELKESVELIDSVYFIIFIIIFGMAIFGVANTMILGTFERQKEFAVVRALGTTAMSVGRTVVYEGVILGFISLVAGALITAPLMIWWHNAPPNLADYLGSFSWAGSVWQPILRVEYSLKAPVWGAVALFITSTFAAVYPAWKATRIPPADALADR
jgi:ABC-type lipoprotein release transport system permease subunit